MELNFFLEILLLASVSSAAYLIIPGLVSQVLKSQDESTKFFQQNTLL